MKVKFPKEIHYKTNESEQNLLLGGEAPALVFTQEAPNTWVALVHVQFPNSGTDGDTRVPEVDIPIRLVTETSLTSKGVRRVLLKAVMPYQSMAAKDDLLTSPIEPNLSRSGGDISVHTVLTLNAAASKDRSGANGGIAKRGCMAQTRLLAAVLSAVSGQLASFQADPDSSPEYLTFLSTDDPAFNGGETIAEEGTRVVGDVPVFVGANTHPQIGVSGDEACGLTLDISNQASEQCLRSILERGLSGLAPIEDSQTIAVSTILKPTALV